MEKKITKQLSKKLAIFHVAVIAIFHLISGVWELLVGATAMESTPSGIHFLLDIYRSYLGTLSIVTFFIGILFLLRFNFARILAIILAWWNLFTAPFFAIWWYIYSESIRNITVENLSISEYLYAIFLISIISATRIYIIRMLNISRAGYVFLGKNSQNIRPQSGEKSG